MTLKHPSETDRDQKELDQLKDILNHTMTSMNTIQKRHIDEEEKDLAQQREKVIQEKAKVIE